MDSSFLINWTILFNMILGLSDLFIFDNVIKITVDFMQTAKTLIRGHQMQCLVRVFTICLCLSIADYHHLHIIHTKYPALGNFDCNTGKNCTVAEQGQVVQTVPVICLQKLFGEDLLSLTVLFYTYSTFSNYIFSWKIVRSICTSPSHFFGR